VTIVSGQTRNREDSRYGCSMHSCRGPQVCPNNVLVPRRILEERLLAGLQSDVLRPEVERTRIVSLVPKEAEKQLVKSQLENMKSEDTRVQMRDTKRFVLANLGSLRELLNGEARTVRRPNRFRR
jgi:hypothetical protein